MIYPFFKSLKYVYKIYLYKKERVTLKNNHESSAHLRNFTGHNETSCRIGLFNRHHGISESVFASLNVGLSVGDDTESVMANRTLVKERLGAKCLLSARQVHGDGIYTLDDTLHADLEVDGFDALITRQRGVGLIIQHADCQAILLYDPEQQVIAAVHSGWRGSVINLVGQTITAMSQKFGTVPHDLQAVISPSLGLCCAEFTNYERELPAAFQKFMTDDFHFDFWQISKQQLLSAGLQEHSVTLPTICTSCSNDYFSYRRACRTGNGVTGRNCSAIVLPEE
jgi:YfiH family protein